MYGLRYFQRIEHSTTSLILFFLFSLYTMKQKKYIFTYTDQVRDYECDLQGIVNNANYQHYLEHTRHKFLEKNQLSFSELHKRGVDCVVARISIDYKNSLRPGDVYISCLNVKKEGIKYVFLQDIYKPNEENGTQQGVLCIRSRIETVALINGRLGTTKELDALAEETDSLKEN